MMKSRDIERLKNIADGGGSRELADVLIVQFDRLAQSQGCSSPRILKHGVLFQRGSGDAIFSVYFSRTSKRGTVEVAIAETDETPNISRIYRRVPQEVRDWINHLQTNVGEYARSSTSQGYPRVSIATVQAGLDLVTAMLAFLEGRPYAVEVKEEPQKAAAQQRVDERILAAIMTRRGQPKFRDELLAAYKSRCAITDCDAVEALEAAHIIGFAEDQNYDVTNGILMRADIHTLFDLFLLSIDPARWTIRVAPQLLRSYRPLEGQRIRLPEDVSLSPNPERMAVHYQEWQTRWGLAMQSGNRT